MGNSLITKNYDLHKDNAATAGHLSLWKIYDGVKKGTTDKVSVWTMQKDELAKRKSAPVTDRTLAEQLFQIMRKDMVTLKELNCDGFIRVIEIVEDSKTTLGFTTETIVCSLADVMNKFENIPGGLEVHKSHFDSIGVFTEIEISRGLLTLSEGLQYLHSVQKRLHLSISPENIVLTLNGQWKFCGMGFSLPYQEDEMRAASPYFLKAQPNAHVAIVEPNLCYAAPELTVGGLTHADIRFLNASTDMFSLGVTFFEIFQYNLFTRPNHRSHNNLIPVFHNNFAQQLSSLENLSRIDLGTIPVSLRPLIVGLLQPEPRARTNANDVINHPYFVTGSLAVLRSVDTLAVRDAGTQSSLLLGYPAQLNDFPPRILETAVLPVICSICTTNPALWVYALQLHVYLSEKITLATYQRIASPYIEQGLAVINPAETMMAFLKNVLFIKERFPAEFYEAHVTLLFLNALDKAHIPLQCAALQTLCDKRVSDAIPQNLYLEKIVPKACREACKNPDAGIKVSALFFLSNACARLDKGYMAKNLVPSLKYISEHDRNPAVTMCVIGTFQTMTAALGSDMVAHSVLPVILPMLTDKALSASQFQMIVSLTKSLLREILDERTTELNIPKVDLGNAASLSAGGSDLYGGYDPFALAKEMIANAALAREKALQAERMERQQQAYSNFSYTGTGTGSSGVAGGISAAPVSEVPSAASMGLHEAPPPLPMKPAPSMMPPPPPSNPPPSMPPKQASTSSGLGGYAGYSSSMNAPSSNYESSAVAVKVTNASDSSISNASTWYSGAATAVSSLFTLPSVPGAVTPAPAPTTPTPVISSGASYSAPVVPGNSSSFGNTNSYANTSSSGYQPSTASYTSPALPPVITSAAPSTAPVASGFSWFTSSGGATSQDPTPAAITPMAPASTPSLDINEDDFVASFQKSSVMSAPSMGTMGHSHQPNSHNKAHHGINTHSPAPNTQGNFMPGLGNNASALTLEQQIAQTQAEIARLSGSSGVAYGQPSAAAANSSGFSFMDTSPAASTPALQTNYATNAPNHRASMTGAVAGNSSMGGMNYPTNQVSNTGMYAPNFPTFNATPAAPTTTAIGTTGGYGGNTGYGNTTQGNNYGNNMGSNMNYGNSSASSGNMSGYGNAQSGNSYGNNVVNSYGNMPANNGMYGNSMGQAPATGYGMQGNASGYGNPNPGNAGGNISGYGNANMGNNPGNSKNIGQISTAGYRPPVASAPFHHAPNPAVNKAKDDPFGLFK